MLVQQVTVGHKSYILSLLTDPLTSDSLAPRRSALANPADPKTEYGEHGEVIW